MLRYGRATINDLYSQAKSEFYKSRINKCTKDQRSLFRITNECVGDYMYLRKMLVCQLMIMWVFLQMSLPLKEKVAVDQLNEHHNDNDPHYVYQSAY